MFVDVSVFRVFVFGAQKSGTHLFDDFFSKKLEKFEKIAIFDLKRLRVTPQKSQSLRLNDVLN